MVCQDKASIQISYMGYFIFDKEAQSLIQDEIHHITNVLRLKPNEIIQATDGKGTLYNLKITSLKPFQTEIIESFSTEKTNPSIRVIVSIIKIPLLELIIQKLTEIGIDEIIITKTDYAQINLKDIKLKQNRWNTIITTACKQSEQVYFPTLTIQELDQIDYTPNSLNLIGDTQYNKPIPIHSIDIENISDINLLIGPEGGFSQKEYADLVSQYSYMAVSFNPNILRAETAAIVGAGILKSLSL
jgi:16S rRNA (uracil1498-N3)-methyltransferase